MEKIGSISMHLFFNNEVAKAEATLYYDEFSPFCKYSMDLHVWGVGEFKICLDPIAKKLLSHIFMRTLRGEVVILEEKGPDG